ncbi:asparagine synthase (glutamine-hydrolyzing) [Luteirhabdus pelagi]|uniref:asparagine synthase (glutamine-hydrolyzing) n=1 Tax=Luteirhabdus pelagi TaxID=2792783 RepID=UPI00193A1780|nr:asparagine synthase (glutamine-hydrolyzing) [Luteirhabdus pelagi]
MCGIAGIVGERPSSEALQRMITAQQHRGPDYTGTYLDEGIALGHNRLAIIDLTSAARQPFASTDGRYVLVFNGEIYNYLELRKELKAHYAFQTNSDTEVLLAAYLHWGKKCLPKLNGMFAFAIWDIKMKSLFAARDRFGVKPFYYVEKNKHLYFASEIKTLFASGSKRTPDEKVWANYFTYGSYGMPDETFWEAIKQVPAGHVLTYENNKLKVSKWYDFEKEILSQPKITSFEEALERYETLLKDSIALRFRSDVPVGFNVSGGLDSSTLLAFVKYTLKGSNSNAYTFYTDDARYDEVSYVEEMMATTEFPLHKVLLRADAVDHLSNTMANVQDEPFGGIPTLAYAEIFKVARQQGVKVLLDGQGMDEQWAGYDYYTKVGNATIQGVRKSPFRPSVLKKELLDLTERPEYPTPFNDTVQNLQYRDLFYTKIPRALRFNDRVSMAASTELREPFLDYRMVEFAFSLPLAYKIRKGQQKFLLRELVGTYLSDSIRYAPKRPLQTPQREWLGNDLEEWVATQIESLKAYPWFDSKGLEREWETYRNGNQESSFHIWQWVNTSLLLKDSH